MAENERSVEQKPRPIIHIGFFLISHSVLVRPQGLSISWCDQFLAWWTQNILSLGATEADTVIVLVWVSIYFGNLNHGSGSPMLSNDDASEGQRFLNKLLSFNSKTVSTGIEIPEVIAEHILELGGEVNCHKFHPLLNKFHQLQFFLGPNAGIVEGNDVACRRFETRLVEGVVRSVNNLLEKFHQSCFLYLLTSPSRFVSVGVYMIAFALLIAPFPLVAASLFSVASKPKLGKYDAPFKPDPTGEHASTFTSWKLLYSAKTVLIVQLWSTIVTLFPYFIYQIPNSSSSINLLTWIILSILSLFFIYAISNSLTFLSEIRPQRAEWALLKSVTIAAGFIGLCLMSVVNFATAEIGALLLAPLCLTIVLCVHKLMHRC